MKKDIGLLSRPLCNVRSPHCCDVLRTLTAIADRTAHKRIGCDVQFRAS